MSRRTIGAIRGPLRHTTAVLSVTRAHWHDAPHQPPTLYRCFDAKGELLYIGMTRQPLGYRMGQHRSEQPWWSEVAYVSIEAQPSPWEGLDAERAAIKAERPRYNKRSAVTA